MKAKQNLEWVQNEVSKEEEFWKAFMIKLQAAAPENIWEEVSNEIDKL